MRIAIPASIILGTFDKQEQRDRVIYTDPLTGKLVVRKGSLSINTIRQFIDEHMSRKLPFQSKYAASKRQASVEGLVAPKYVLKTMRRTAKDAEVTIFYDKNQLLQDILESRGQYELIVQQFVI